MMGALLDAPFPIFSIKPCWTGFSQSTAPPHCNGHFSVSMAFFTAV